MGQGGPLPTAHIAVNNGPRQGTTQLNKEYGVTYTVADVDRVMDGRHELPGWPEGTTYKVEGLWSEFKYQEVSSLPTELGVISYVDDFGGEGQGDEYWVVVKIVGHDGSERFFKKPGWYQSFSGGELDGDTYEVKPTERTVTFYE